MRAPASLLVLAGLLAACSGQPRAASYFKAHPQETSQVLVQCAAGTRRGAECVNAQAADTQVRSDARLATYRKGF